MVSVWVKKQVDGKLKVVDQVTGEVYGIVNDTREVVDFVREKTGDLDVLFVDGQ
ncbi:MULTISPECIES: hypothetical protein [Pandoraea]|uniref:hypothetical protein n=1 Tax=Pandoraea TaxID=93217 RepID=UPI001F5CD291|nr:MULTISPECIES: hypothetical protein [Pandoraea]